MPGAQIGADRAVDRTLREAGGGRLAEVRVARDFGRVSYLVQLAHETWLCTAPAAETAESASIVDDRVFTCAASSHVSRHGYATAGYDGPMAGVPEHPEVLSVVRPDGGEAWLLASHRGGLLSAHVVN
jgi:hypothetical protein